MGPYQIRQRIIVSSYAVYDFHITEFRKYHNSSLRHYIVLCFLILI